MLVQNLQSWKDVTGGLPWGVQRVLHETLDAVKEGKVSLVHGADYRNGKPCLINAAAVMFSHDEMNPSEFAPLLVGLFDTINRDLVTSGVNDDSGYVSPLAAEILLHNFGEFKDAEKPVITLDDVKYIEPSDAEMATDWQAAKDAKSWLQSMSAPPAHIVMDTDDQYAKDFVTARIFADENSNKQE